jgi:hypothetical protein
VLDFSESPHLFAFIAAAFDVAKCLVLRDGISITLGESVDRGSIRVLDAAGMGMMPRSWRWGAGLGGVGALAIAPYLAGACILMTLGLPFKQLSYGVAYAYWQALDLPAFAPFAARIRWAGGIGFTVAPLAWVGCLIVASRRGRALAPLRRVPDFLQPAEVPRDGTWTRSHQPILTAYGFRRLRLPAGESLLLAAQDYPATHGVLKRALREVRGPVLVIDLDGAMYEATAGWRASKGEVVRLTPFGAGAPWNPFADSWTCDGLRHDALDALAACWYPERHREDRVLVSHVRAVFRGLISAVDEVLRAAGERVPPAPGDLWRLLALSQGRLDRDVLSELAKQSMLSKATRDALRACVALDDDTLARASERLRGPLNVFAYIHIDAGTRGTGLSLTSPAQATVYLHVPYASRQDAIPIIEALVAQWRERILHEDALVVVHGLDLLPALPFLKSTDERLRCIASVRSVAALFESYGHAERALMRRFGVIAMHAPRERVHAEREAAALTRHVAYRHANAQTAYAKALRTEQLFTLRRGEQVVFAPLLSHPLRCRVVGTRRRAPAPPFAIQGEPMPFPKPLAALLTALIAGCSAPAQKVVAESLPSPCGPMPRYDDPEGITEVRVGPRRFCLPERLFNGTHIPWGHGTEVDFVLDWPSLEPLPAGFDMYEDNSRFLAALSVGMSYPDRLTDEQFRTLPRRWIEPFDPTDPEQLANPGSNLHLRIKGEAVHGLTPYYTDFDALQRYYKRKYGPDTRAADPDGRVSDDWFIDMGPDGIPRTVLKCSPQAIPDGVRMEGDRMVELRGVFMRAVCEHDFVIPEYRVIVNLQYQRMVMPDWRRIETRIRTLFREGEVNR